MNLIEILTNNGTGILKGVCVAENDIFLDYIHKGEENIIIKKFEEEIAFKFKVKFSLNEKYLGEYTLEIEDYSEHFISANLILEDKKKAFIEINIESLGYYGDFIAFLR